MNSVIDCRLVLNVIIVRWCSININYKRSLFQEKKYKKHDSNCGNSGKYRRTTHSRRDLRTKSEQLGVAYWQLFKVSHQVHENHTDHSGCAWGGFLNPRSPGNLCLMPIRPGACTFCVPVDNSRGGLDGLTNWTEQTCNKLTQLHGAVPVTCAVA